MVAAGEPVSRWPTEGWSHPGVPDGCGDWPDATRAVKPGLFHGSTRLARHDDGLEAPGSRPPLASLRGASDGKRRRAPLVRFRGDTRFSGGDGRAMPDDVTSGGSS